MTVPPSSLSSLTIKRLKKGTETLSEYYLYKTLCETIFKKQKRVGVGGVRITGWEHFLLDAFYIYCTKYIFGISCGFLLDNVCQGIFFLHILSS